MVAPSHHVLDWSTHAKLGCHLGILVQKIGNYIVHADTLLTLCATGYEFQPHPVCNCCIVHMWPAALKTMHSNQLQIVCWNKVFCLRNIHSKGRWASTVDMLWCFIWGTKIHALNGALHCFLSRALNKFQEQARYSSLDPNNIWYGVPLLSCTFLDQLSWHYKAKGCGGLFLDWSFLFGCVVNLCHHIVLKFCHYWISKMPLEVWNAFKNEEHSLKLSMLHLMSCLLQIVTPAFKPLFSNHIKNSIHQVQVHWIASLGVFIPVSPTVWHEVGDGLFVVFKSWWLCHHGGFSGLGSTLP